MHIFHTRLELSVLISQKTKFKRGYFNTISFLRLTLTWNAYTTLNGTHSNVSRARHGVQFPIAIETTDKVFEKSSL